MVQGRYSSIPADQPDRLLPRSFIAGWLLVVEFIFTLAMALKCYPLQPGGLLAIEAVLIGMTSAEQVKHELVANIEVLLLLVFMVAGIYFMKQLLLYVYQAADPDPPKTLLSLAFVWSPPSCQPSSTPSP